MYLLYLFDRIIIVQRQDVDQRQVEVYTLEVFNPKNYYGTKKQATPF
jgi:hypothetical protein